MASCGHLNILPAGEQRYESRVGARSLGADATSIHSSIHYAVPVPRSGDRSEVSPALDQHV